MTAANRHLAGYLPDSALVCSKAPRWRSRISALLNCHCRQLLCRNSPDRREYGRLFAEDRDRLKLRIIRFKEGRPLAAAAQDWAQAQPAGRPGNSQAVDRLSTVVHRSAVSGASRITQMKADKVAKASPDLARKVAHGEIALQGRYRRTDAGPATMHPCRSNCACRPRQGLGRVLLERWHCERDARNGGAGAGVEAVSFPATATCTRA
jgi:hypothetical protein